MTQLSEQERHSVEHARYQADRATPDNPECCFDYELVKTLVGIVDRFRQPQSPQQPVMWRCKDYADGWITFEREDSAQRYQAQTGCLMQPLYAGPIPLSDTRPDRNSK